MVAEVAAADAGQPGPDADPVRAGQLGRVDVVEARAARRWPRRRARPSRRRVAAAKRASLRSKRSAFIARPSRDGPPVDGAPRWRADSSGPIGSERPRPAGRLRPLLDQPAPLAGERGQAGLGVDGHREADRLEHRQVGRWSRRRRRSPPARGPRRRSSRPGSGPGSRRSAAPSVELAGVGAVGASTRQLGGDDLVEQRPQRLDHEVERAGDEHRAVAERAGARAPGGWRRGSYLVRISSAEQLGRVLVDLRRPARPRSGGRRSAGSRRGPCGRAPAAPGASASVRSDEAQPLVARRAGGWPATSSDSTTFDAMSVFSRSNAARWRSGESTWRAAGRARLGPVRLARRGLDPGVLDDRRQVDRR